LPFTSLIWNPLELAFQLPPVQNLKDQLLQASIPNSGVKASQGWRRQVIGAHVGMDAPLEVAVARKHRRSHQVGAGNGFDYLSG
jgi:hypothetical protein